MPVSLGWWCWWRWGWGGWRVRSVRRRRWGGEQRGRHWRLQLVGRGRIRSVQYL